MREKTRHKLPIGQLILLLVLCVGLVILMISRVGMVKKQDAAESGIAPIATPLPPVSGPEATPAPAETATPTPEPTATPEPTPVPEPEYYTISMVGDCTLSAAENRKGWGDSYEVVVNGDFAYPFSNTKQFFEQDDLSIANLECILTDNYYPNTIEWFGFKSGSEYAQILVNGDIEFVTLANNHTQDYGEKAYNDTKVILDEAGIAYAGEEEWYIYETDRGLKVGLYCLYKKTEPKAEHIDAGIKALEEAGAELKIVLMHWGKEGSYRPTDTQNEMGRYAIDAGFDVVYGSHAHRLQPVETYNGGIIIHNLGNWTFGGHTNPDDKDTAIAQVTVKKVGESVTVDGLKLIPCRLSTVDYANNYCPTPYEEGSAEYNRAMSKLNGTFEGADYVVDYTNYFATMG